MYIACPVNVSQSLLLPFLALHAVPISFNILMKFTLVSLVFRSYVHQCVACPVNVWFAMARGETNCNAHGYLTQV